MTLNGSCSTLSMKYSGLCLIRTTLGPALGVRYRDVSAEVKARPASGLRTELAQPIIDVRLTDQGCPPYKGVRLKRIYCNTLR